ncbi:hypothetical protein DPMN_073102 [Dreissena polymorpha]|uniref:Uncharacterized protein n=1 Tax=Dreissena polymorpha TaxID=45954 RepID=A0A9D4BYF0_DREPO|nr:hypothetical protein DPMN_073102 [Dreissena polymorpha]
MVVEIIARVTLVEDDRTCQSGCKNGTCHYGCSRSHITRVTMIAIVNKIAHRTCRYGYIISHIEGVTMVILYRTCHYGYIISHYIAGVNMVIEIEQLACYHCCTSHITLVIVRCLRPDMLTVWTKLLGVRKKPPYRDKWVPYRDKWKFMEKKSGREKEMDGG